MFVAFHTPWDDVYFNRTSSLAVFKRTFETSPKVPQFCESFARLR